MEFAGIKLESSKWDDSDSSSVDSDDNTKRERESEAETDYKQQSQPGTNDSTEAQTSSNTNTNREMETDSEREPADLQWQPLTGTRYSFMKFPFSHSIQPARPPDSVERECFSGTGWTADSPRTAQQTRLSEDKGCVELDQQPISPSDIKQEPSTEDDDDDDPPVVFGDATDVNSMRVPTSSSGTYTIGPINLIKSEPLDGEYDWDKTGEERPDTRGEGNKPDPPTEDDETARLGGRPASIFPNVSGSPPHTSNDGTEVFPASLHTTADQSPDSEKSIKERGVPKPRTVPKGASEDRPYVCDQCQASFKQPVYLKRHLRTHSGIKPWKCQQCGKAFIRRSELSIHVRSHSGEKPYKCSHCDSSFAQRGHLQVHTRTHTGEKPRPFLTFQ